MAGRKVADNIDAVLDRRNEGNGWMRRRVQLSDTLFIAHIEELWHRLRKRGQIEPPFGHIGPVSATEIRCRGLRFGFTEYTQNESPVSNFGNGKGRPNLARVPQSGAQLWSI